MYQTSLEVVSKWRQNGLRMAKIGGNGMFEKNPLKKDRMIINTETKVEMYPLYYSYLLLCASSK